ncbi:MAG: hypothetical protein LBH38_00030, partial [Holosporales bacterium]|nr:hypothetical protein [Holosporales bacterium]
AGFLYDWSWSSTYARGQAAVLLWIARGLVLSAGYTLKLNTGPLPFDVLALLTRSKKTYVDKNKQIIVFAPIEETFEENLAFPPEEGTHKKVSRCAVQ